MDHVFAISARIEEQVFYTACLFRIFSLTQSYCGKYINAILLLLLLSNSRVTKYNACSPDCIDVKCSV